MYWLIKIAKHKAILSVVAVFAFVVMVAPSGVVFGVDEPQDFGVSQFESQLDLKVGDDGLQGTIAQIINVALSLLGIVAVVIILIGGFKWMTAGGAEEKVDEAKKVIFSGIIGLAIILSAWAIAKFVLTSLATATGTGADADFIDG